MSEIITYGQTAYEAYRSHSDGRSLVSGDPIPEWGDLGDAVKAAWMAAGSAVADTVIADGAASRATVLGYQGAAQHTYTTACDGFHEPGQCPRSERHGVQFGDGNTQLNDFRTHL